METGQRSNWMLYGAYGRTGRLILDEALRRGHRPVLAGRDPSQLSALRQATGLGTQMLSLKDGPALRAALSDVNGVLLAAGPYHQTGPAMRAACLEARCSYLDVNAGLDDFAAALDCHEHATSAGISIVPGAGYGVVFGESVAAHVAARLPGANWLRLSLATETAGHSRAATLTSAGALAGGGRDIHAGVLRPRALAFATWRAPVGDPHGMRFAAAPLAELVAAHRSTGIPNVVAGIPLSRTAAALMRIGGRLLGRLLLGAGRFSARTESPRVDEASATWRSRAWAEAGDADGASVAAVIETGEGYLAAAAAAVRALERQLQGLHPGAYTPVQAFGRGFAALVPGTSIQEL